jgi:hypothetical protein
MSFLSRNIVIGASWCIGTLGTLGSLKYLNDNNISPKLEKSEELIKLRYGYYIEKDENNKRFYKTALEQYKNNDDRLCIHVLDFQDVRRVLNPPTTLINPENMTQTTIKIADKEAKIKYLSTNHGIYVKLLEPIYDGNVESAFGFGLGCSGFDPDKIVYYPNHKQTYTTFVDALNKNTDPNLADFSIKDKLKYSPYV